MFNISVPANYQPLQLDRKIANTAISSNSVRIKPYGHKLQKTLIYVRDRSIFIFLTVVFFFFNSANQQKSIENDRHVQSSRKLGSKGAQL